MRLSECFFLFESHKDWQCEGYSFSRASPILGNYITALKDDVKGLILNREEFGDALFAEYIEHVLILNIPTNIFLILKILIIERDSHLLFMLIASFDGRTFIVSLGHGCNI